MSDRIPPHSESAERSVLGAIMVDDIVLREVLEMLDPKDFYIQKNKEIYEAIREVAKKAQRGTGSGETLNVDTITVVEELEKRGTLSLVGATYVASLPSDVPSLANAESYAELVREKSMLRQLIQFSSEVQSAAYDLKMDVEDLLGNAERDLMNISRKTEKKDYVKLEDLLKANLDDIDDRTQKEGNLVGLTSGFQDLDSRTSGFQKSDLIIVAARPSMGKTSFALCIAQNAALKADANVMIFSLEMSATQISERLLSMESSIELAKIKSGEVDTVDWGDLFTAADRLNKAGIYVDDTPGISVNEMKNKCRRFQAKNHLDLVVIDYLQLMSIKGFREGRQLEVSTLSRMLKQMARELGCPVIVLSQLSRAVESRSDHRPQLSDLRESGAIEQDADLVMFLYRDEYYNPDTEKPNIAEVNIAKHRNGPTGTVELAWLGKYTKFADKSPLMI